MSEAENQRYGRIPGLKGLLPGLAKQRGMEAICLRGEMPDYIARIPIPYPRASKAVLEVLAGILEIDFDFQEVDEMIGNMKQVVDKSFRRISPGLSGRGLTRGNQYFQANRNYNPGRGKLDQPTY